MRTNITMVVRENVKIVLSSSRTAGSAIACLRRGLLKVVQCMDQKQVWHYPGILPGTQPPVYQGTHGA